MAQYNSANGSYVDNNKSLYDVVYIAGDLSPHTNSTSAHIDYSANQPALPNVFQNFAASGPYASYVFVKASVSNSAISNIEVYNNSGARIVLILDDGVSANNVAPNNATCIPLDPGSGVGSQGGSWNSQFFKGRVQIYAPANTAQVALSIDL